MDVKRVESNAKSLAHAFEFGRGIECRGRDYAPLHGTHFESIMYTFLLWGGQAHHAEGLANGSQIAWQSSLSSNRRRLNGNIHERICADPQTADGPRFQRCADFG
jgi:hypothetical protein